MQFPVPQFTEVEDKIIGSLTLKQFGIVFAAGVVVFLGYSATKSILVLVFLIVLFGLPALALAFVPFNGRPIYNTIGLLAKYVMSPKLLIFHKEAQDAKFGGRLKDAEVSSVVVQKPEEHTQKDTQDNLAQVQALLAKTAGQEKEVAGKLKY